MKSNGIPEHIFISLPKKDLQDLIIDCVNACLRHNSKVWGTKSNRYMSPEEAADLFKIPVGLLIELADKSSIPVYKRGKQIIFQEKELFEWVCKYHAKKVGNIQSEKSKEVSHG